MARCSADYPGAHPEPPQDLAHRELPLISDRRRWFRLHRIDRDPIYFGRTAIHRFDAPDGVFGVMYLGDSPQCSFVETFGRSDHGHRIVTTRSLKDRALAALTFARPLRLIDLAATGLAHVSADARLTTGDYTVAQRWSHALWSHPAGPDGLLYRSRHDPSRFCLALYERAANAVARVDRLGSLADPAHGQLLVEMLDAYAIGLIDLE